MCKYFHLLASFACSFMTMLEDVLLGKFEYLVCTCLPGESYCTWRRSLLLCLCDSFWMLIKSLNCVLILSVFIQKRVVFLHHVSAPLGTAILIDSLAVKSKQSWPRHIWHYCLTYLSYLWCHWSRLQSEKWQHYHLINVMRTKLKKMLYEFVFTAQSYWAGLWCFFCSVSPLEGNGN